MLTGFVDFYLQSGAQEWHFLSFQAPFMPSSLIFHPASVAKGICFGGRKTVFCNPKDGLSEGESLSFASERSIVRKTRIAHSHPSSFIPLLSAAADTLHTHGWRICGHGIFCWKIAILRVKRERGIVKKCFFDRRTIISTEGHKDRLWKIFSLCLFV